MSTKGTVAHGPNFHLYHEALDDDYIYLELEGVQFEASYNRVMVPVPIHIWEVIRQYSGVDLSFAEKTDNELRQYVEQQVDERIARYHESEQKAQGLIRIFGSLVYGTADMSREQQVENGIAYFEKLREHQQQIKQAIAELEQLNRRK
jgi:hypothetical protein